MAGPNIFRFSGGVPPKKQKDERLRLYCLSNKNDNSGYCLIGKQIIIGRDFSCDLVIEDMSASRKHVEINWKKDHYYASDLKSVNGFLINGEKVKGARLESGDIITIGSTEFEVTSPGEKKGLKIGSIAPQSKSTDKDLLKKRQFLIIVGIAILVVMAITLGEDVKTFREKGIIPFADLKRPIRKIPKKEANKIMDKLIKSYTPTNARQRSAEIFFRKGQKEFYNKNYRRAITALETALTIDSKHDLAKVYLGKSHKSLEEQVELSYKAATSAADEFRFREARKHYMNVMHFLAADPKNPRYIEAQEKIKLLDKLEGRMNQ